jgi:hypothetical protein
MFDNNLEGDWLIWGMAIFCVGLVVYLLSLSFEAKREARNRPPRRPRGAGPAAKTEVKPPQWERGTGTEIQK